MECKACGVWFVSDDKSGVCHTCKQTLKNMGLDLQYDVTVGEDDVNFETDKIPAAGVAPVVHGKRLKEVYRDSYGADWTRYVCSLFGRVEIKKEPYCNCGAKMDGGEKANE